MRPLVHVDPTSYIDRELSWLDFNNRVLELAEDNSLPLLERVRFMAIVSSNLDDFFMIRAASAKLKVESGLNSVNFSGYTATQLFEAILEKSKVLVKRQNELWHSTLLHELAQRDIHIIRWHDLTVSERDYIKQLFDTSIFPVLTPLAVDRMMIEDYYAFRLTRNEDLDLEEDESDNLLETMEQELQRRKFGPPVRLEVEDDIKPELLERLVAELEITNREVFKNRGPLDFTGLNFIADLERPELKFPPFRGVLPAPFPELEEAEANEFFHALKQGEVLLHHPYHSFSSTVVRFLETAATDPNVLAIKQTLYRTSGDSPIIEALLEAAAAGKQVLAVIEIRARFDELANVRWARKLEEAGVHVVYGLMGLKTHAKLSLVVRKENGHLQRYCHVGTGNYNPKTARLYEDFGLLSSDARLCEDLSRLFNQLSGFVREENFERLLVAPNGLRKGLLERIDREIQNAKSGKVARIRLKLNALLDEEFVDALYEASIAGVKVESNVRGICSIKPGIPGKSENIVVRSFLGRYLEHSRIFHFHNAGNDEYWIGSADLMDRNLNRRIEALVRIEAEDHKAELDGILNLYADPGIVHWFMGQNGEWRRIVNSEEGRLEDLHTILMSRVRHV
ncbi:MAG: polyphosphate kinase 1 [Actinobacteria bacterium]|nr:polyphosphate kinase 1 [Actinomycetota bacterium]